MKKPATKAKQASGRQLSQVAARVLRELKDFESPHAMIGAYSDGGRPAGVYVRDVRAIADSCLAESEMPGKRK